jgi:hypothetical protein
MNIVLGNTCSGKGLFVDLLKLSCPIKKEDPKNDKRDWEEILKDVSYNKVLYVYRDPRVSFILEISDILSRRGLKRIDLEEMLGEIDKFGDCSDLIDKIKRDKEVFTLKFEDYLKDPKKTFKQLTDFFEIEEGYTPQKHYNKYLTKFDGEKINTQILRSSAVLFPLISHKYQKEIEKWKYEKKLSIEDILKLEVDK